MAAVFATSDIGAEALALVRSAGHELDVWPHVAAPPHDVLVARAATSDGMITTLRDRIDAEVLAAGAGRLRVIAQDAVGLDNVDVAEATRRGIVVTNTPDVLTEATAEFALFLLGALARRIPSSERLVRGGGWTSWHAFHPFLGTEVTGKTVAVIGCGRIGRAFAAKCTGLDVNLLLVGTLPTGWLGRIRAVQAAKASVGRAAWARPCELDDALPQADFVSLHVPLVEAGPRATRGLLDARRLALMRPGAFLVNTARGAVVDEGALVAALRSRTIAGAALDVFATEPLPATSPLLHADLADRVLPTHHFGSGTTETRLGLDPETGMAGRCVAGLLDALSATPTGRFATNART